MTEYSGPERRVHPMLSDDQIDHIAEKAAGKAIEKMQNEVYSAVGKSIISKLSWLVGILAIGTAAWMQSKGFFK